MHCCDHDEEPPCRPKKTQCCLMNELLALRREKKTIKEELDKSPVKQELIIVKRNAESLSGKIKSLEEEKEELKVEISKIQTQLSERCKKLNDLNLKLASERKILETEVEKASCELKNKTKERLATQNCFFESQRKLCREQTEGTTITKSTGVFNYPDSPEGWGKDRPDKRKKFNTQPIPFPNEAMDRAEENK